MTEPHTPAAAAPNPPLATLAAPRRTRLSPVWIIPLIALLVALGIAVNALLGEGPTITIVLKDAEGIEAGKTFVKYKDVNIGQVSAVQLTDDFEQVEVKAKITKRAAALMVSDAKFWVVRPRVSLSGVSGLGTLIGGNYIGFSAGQSGDKENRFAGLDIPPVTSNGQGREFILKAADLGSLGTGSPVYFRKLQVGQVASYDLADDGKTMEIKVLIETPYTRYVTANTRFWNASGVDVSLGANGVELRTESLVALLAGGIAFDTPARRADDENGDNVENGKLPATPSAPAEPAPANSAYALFADRAAAMKQVETVVHSYVLGFDESLRGLSVGAPVTFYGLPIGVVTDVGLADDPVAHDIRPRVNIDFYPERIIAHLAPEQKNAAQRALIKDGASNAHAELQRLVGSRGLRAQLRSGNLLTGQLYIAFDFFPNAPPAKVNWNARVPRLPVMPSTLPDLESKLSSLMNKLDKLPLEGIANDLQGDLKALRQTLDQAGALIRRADGELLPELAKTLATADRLIAHADKTLVGPDAPLQQDLRDALQELTNAARSLRTLADYLERHPESLLRGKAASPTGEP